MSCAVFVVWEDFNAAQPERLQRALDTARRLAVVCLLGVQRLARLQHGGAVAMFHWPWIALPT